MEFFSLTRIESLTMEQPLKSNKATAAKIMDRFMVIVWLMKPD